MVMALAPAVCACGTADRRSYSTAPLAIPSRNKTMKAATLNRESRYLPCSGVVGR